MAIDPSSVMSFASSVSMPFAYAVGGVVLGHYVPKAWTLLAAMGANVKAVYNVGKLVVAQQAASVAPAVAALALPAHIDAAVAAVVPKA